MINPMSRRNFIRTGATVAGGLALGGVLPSPAEAAATAPLPVDSDALKWFAEPVPLASASVMQSFAVDNVNRHIYTAQRLASSTDTSGDITITKLSLSNGSKVDPVWIHLRGFGHAAGLGVVPFDAEQGGGAMIWIETSVESDSNRSPYGGATGYGTKIARLHMGGSTGFQQNADVHALTADNDPDGPYYDVFDPRPDFGQKSIAVDVPNSKISLRYHTDSDTIVHEQFKLGDFIQHIYSDPANKTTLDYSVFTSRFPEDNPPVFQGHTTFGEYFYMLTGKANTNNQRLWSFKWANITNPPPYDVALSQAGSGFSYHEPEGMSVVTAADGSGARLMFGVATGESGARKAMFYYKE